MSLKINYNRGYDCIEKFCKDLREHSTKIINYEDSINTGRKKRL